jgi:type IV secretory pathway component VirB8
MFSSLFSRKSALHQSASTGADVERRTPGTTESLTATGVYIDMVQGLKAQNQILRRNNHVWQLVGLLAVAGLVLVMPLKKRIPYFYEVDSATGQVSLSSRVVEELKVSDKNVAYFLRVWVARVLTINAATLRDGLPSAYRWTRGAAQNELDDWTETEDKTAARIAKTPGLTREILGVPTVSFNEDRSIAFIDLVTVEKVSGIERDRKRRLMAVEFAALNPKASERNAAEEADNPLALTITHFTINDQVSK